MTNETTTAPEVSGQSAEILPGQLTPELERYAAELILAGFTVYLPTPKLNTQGTSIPLTWFHYSREVNLPERLGEFVAQVLPAETITCYGTVHAPEFPLLDPEGFTHSMPITPSRLNGSGAHVAVARAVETLSVEYAEIVASLYNYCPANAEPTPEAIAAAERPSGAPQRYYKGTTLPNAEPWGIGATYRPASLIVGAR